MKMQTYFSLKHKHLTDLRFSPPVVLLCYSGIQNKSAYIHKLIYRGSYMSALVLLNLLNELRKRDKM